jgi:hypothetical protein
MTEGISYNKTSVLTRVTTKFGEGDKWRYDAKANYIRSQGKNRPATGINPGNAFYAIATLPRSLDVMQFKQSTDDFGKMIWFDDSKTTENPWWLLQNRHNEDTRDRLMGNMLLGYDFTSWLSAEIKGGTDYYTTQTNEKQYAGGIQFPTGRYLERSATFQENNFSAIINAQKDDVVSKVGLAATLGGNMMQQYNTEMEANVGDLSMPDVFNINNGKTAALLKYTKKQQKINSLYGSAQINWDAYLFLELTLRNDWSSTMSKANRSFMYPSVSFSGVISDMLTKNGVVLPSWFSFAKVRASYADVGNPLEPYQLYNTYVLGRDPNGNVTSRPDDILFDPNVVNESVKTIEAGVDLRFFQGRLGVDFAWYRRNATNQLLDLPMDPSSGYKSKKVNAGNIQNQGWETMLTGRIIENPNGFNWWASANFSSNKSKIVELADGITEYTLTKHANEAVTIVAIAGGGYGDIYGYKFKRDEQGRIMVDDSGLPLKTDKREYIGNQQPDWMFGFTNNFEYKGFTLGLGIDGRVGGYIFSGTSSLLHQFGNAAGTVENGRADFVVPNSVVATTGDWNTVAVSPQNYWTRVTGEVSNVGLAELFAYDASNIRLRNLSLGYQFNAKQLKGLPIQKLGLSFSFNNLWMIYYNLPGIDPESVLGTNTNAAGFELGSSPTTRTYTFNINISF